MRRSVYLLFGLMILLTNCGTQKILTTYVETAENQSAAGNYDAAMDTWHYYIDNVDVEDINGSDFAKAAQTAFLAGDSDQALKWYDQARFKNYSDAEMYSTLANIFRSQDNLSRELTALEFYVENFSENLIPIYSRLFEIYAEIENSEKAIEVWSKLDTNTKNNISKQKDFFKINAELENNEVCDSLSLIILEKEPENIDALEWNAKKYYWLGENRYQEENEKYNNNRTTRQYRILLEELEKVTEDFKKSLVYFDKLWELDPGSKYATYVSNIYARFGDQEKSDYYKQFQE